MEKTINNNSSLSLFIEEIISNKQKDLDFFRKILKDIDNDNISFIQLWKTLLQTNCKDTEIYENLVYSVFKGVKDVAISFDILNNLRYIVVTAFSVSIYLPIEWPINWRMSNDKKVDVILKLDENILNYVWRKSRVATNNRSAEKNSNYLFLIEYTELLKSKASLYKRLKCRYKNDSTIKAYFLYFTQGYWRDKKLKRDLSYYETELDKYIRVEHNLNHPSFVKENYVNYITYLKPLIYALFEQNNSLLELKDLTELEKWLYIPHKG